MNPKQLTPRELEVLGLMAEGMTCKEIARAIHRRKPTADWHMRNVREKLGVDNHVAALRRAVDLGLITIERRPLI